MDDIHARAPVNKLAALSVSKGEHFIPQKKIQTNDSINPIALRELTSCEQKAQGFINLTGRTFGRFVVLGAAKEFNKQWVVKCSCGMYTTRSSKAIKNPNNVQDRCEHCKYLAFLKRDYHYQITGKNKDIKEY
jgi:hypothetical protein